MDMKSDSKLVKAVLKGDRHAYGCLFKRHERSVQAVALGILGDYHAAQDAVQEAFDRLEEMDPDKFHNFIVELKKMVKVVYKRGM